MRASRLWTAVIVVGAAAASYALYLWLTPAPLPAQVLYGNGHVEGTEVTVSAEVGGRVIDSRIEEGRGVAKGDALLGIDDTALELEKARAEAQISSLVRQREASNANLEVWLHHQTTARAALQRSRTLAQTDYASPQQVDEATNAAEQASGQMAAIKADIAALDAQIVAARRQRDIVDLQIEKTNVVAPINGTILTKAAEVGEFLQPGSPVAVLVDLSKVYLKVYLPEAEIGKLTLDAPARVRVDAFPDRFFDAHVAEIDQQAQFTPRDIHMPQERTRMVFGVKLAIANPEGVLKPGMPADAWILWHRQAGWPDQLFVPGERR